MPGPGNKKVKAKGKKATNFSAGQNRSEYKGDNKKLDNGIDATLLLADPKAAAFVTDLNETEEWKACADIISGFLGLPGSYNWQSTRFGSNWIFFVYRLIYA